ncbi:MAG: biotin--[acetyl-CoA-carboxylase] ligase [Acidimicrobiia bacterium]|nr:biotin--[acetyl-CoA-carboxylase] ligase [Acidimicrobiia bacterium]
MATPYVSIVLEDIPSTQDEAVARADDAPVLVVAARQSAGRGRGGRRWETAPRAMAASLAIRPRGWKAAQFGCLSLVAALAGRAVLGEDIGCKWPNDLLRDDAKVAGLLLEASGDLVVIGLGVNLWWPDPPAGFGSLFETDPGPDNALELASGWCDDLLARIDRGPGEWGRAEYRRACGTIGRAICWSPGGAGRAIDVDEEGRLVVETATGRITLSSGEVWEVG